MKSLLAFSGVIAGILVSGCGSVEEEEAGPQEPPNASGQVTSKVTYVPDSTLATEELAGETLVVYQRPPDIRIDDYAKMDGRPFSSIRIDAERGSYNCYDLSQISSPGLRQCESSQPSVRNLLDRSLEDSLGLLGTVPQEGAQMTGTSQRVIAGLAAECFQLQRTTEKRIIDGELCFSEEGVLLLARTTSPEGENSWTAVEVSNDATDLDFEPPYPVVEPPR